MFAVICTVWVNSSASVYCLHLIIVLKAAHVCPHMNRFLWTDPPLFHCQTDEERQQALQAFAAQSFLGAAQHTASSSGSGSSVHVFSSPISSSEHKTKMKRVPRKTQNEKYRLKYLRLRKAARALVFVSELFLTSQPRCVAFRV